MPRQQNIDKQQDATTKTFLPENIQGYKVEREYGQEDIRECIRKIISLHIN